jgi:methylglutaconyl-CoA hydratase
VLFAVQLFILNFIMESKDYIKLSRSSKIAELIFYSDKSNSLPTKMLNELIAHFNNLSDDPSINVIVLRSDGDKAFCAGASFDELIEIEDFASGKKFFMGFAELINAMRKCRKIIVGRIHSKVVGGGVGLAAASDYTLASRDASLRLSELALGLGPFVIGPPIERKIGKEAFTEMSLDCEWRSAEWGKQHGIYTEIFDTYEELDDHLKNFTEQLSERSPDALENLKKIFWEGTDDWDRLLEERAESSGKLVLSDYTKNYIRDFKNKSL